MRVLRSEIADLEIHIAPKCFLHGEIPLLRVAGPYLPVDPENTLSQPRIRVRRSHRHGRTLGQYKRRIDVVLRLLAHRLYKRKLRQRERCRDARLLEPDHPVTRANYPGLAE